MTSELSSGLISKVDSALRKLNSALKKWGGLDVVHMVLLIVLVFAIAIIVVFLSKIFDCFKLFEFGTEKGKINVCGLSLATVAGLWGTLKLRQRAGYSWWKQAFAVMLLVCALLIGTIRCMNALSEEGVPGWRPLPPTEDISNSG